ncbi:MAG TPA: APC family permease [Thermoguttaceae bacterium]|nr:APC family permease [Thermoguttaceae bacterium]
MHERLTKAKALAVLSSDALSSVAYATEEILLVLVLAGTAALSASVPIAIVIAGLLAVVGTSYYQTIHGYPSGGGAYIVAHENLGVWPGLTAAAALLIDYVLTVAVSISAGVVAVTSAFPSLSAFRVELCLVLVAMIAWGNLRGVRESGTLFAIPTYAFIAVFLSLLVTGFVRLATRTLDAAEPVISQASAHPLTLLLILRAFSSGCTALTGVEAISNGIPAFHKPEAANAGKTLIAMVALLMTMFLGVTLLAHWLGLVPVEHESLVSQIGRRVFGDGWLYLGLQAVTTLILILAANTSFADFPRLSSILARDGYVPRQMANLGDRLVFSNGILMLAVLAGTVILVFGGQPHRMIPLYAVGVFLSFTLSQTGMVFHWQKLRSAGWSWRAGINGVGALATGLVLVVLAESKLTGGAWIILLLIPAFVFLFRAIKRHYIGIAQQLAVPHEGRLTAWSPDSEARHKVIVPFSRLNRCSLAAVEFARSLSRDVTAVIVDVDDEVTAGIAKRWEKLVPDVPLEVLQSPFRSVIQPLVEYLDEVDRRDPERGPAVVVLPEVVPARWWHNLLHNQTAMMLKAVLLYRRSRSREERVIIDVPYHLKR